MVFCSILVILRYQSIHKCTRWCLLASIVQHDDEIIKAYYLLLKNNYSYFRATACKQNTCIISFISVRKNCFKYIIAESHTEAVLTFSVRWWIVSSLSRSTGLKNISSADISTPQTEHNHYLHKNTDRTLQTYIRWLIVASNKQSLIKVKGQAQQQLWVEARQCLMLCSIWTGKSKKVPSHKI